MKVIIMILNLTLLILWIVTGLRNITVGMVTNVDYIFCWLVLILLLLEKCFDDYWLFDHWDDWWG